MRCPKCACMDDKVIDTRLSRDGDAIRRRRQCVGCSHRFTTYEAVVRTEKQVVKRDGCRQDFNPEKLRLGLRSACWKRPVGEEMIDEIVRSVAGRIDAMPDREISSEAIGALVMQELRDADEVAYVRFASVYRRFKDADQFVSEVHRLSEDQDETAQA